MEGTEKIVCMPYGHGQENGCNGLAMASLMNNQNNSWSNNPFAYLIWLMAMRWMNNGEAANGENFNSRQISALQDTVNTNHNNDLAMQAISGNTAAIRELAASMNCSFDAVNAGVCGVKSAIEKVGGDVGITGERVVSSIIMGNKDLTAALQTCCCENKTLQMQNFAALQLQNCQNNGALMSRIDQLANGVQTGFAQIGYAQAQQTCQIVNAIKDSEQRTIDALNAHWTGELADKLQDAKFKVSQMEQTQTLIAALKTSSTTTA